MEILILFGIVVVPLFVIALYAIYKERKEREAELQVQNP
jgi:hypothetical protein